MEQAPDGCIVSLLNNISTSLESPQSWRITQGVAPQPQQPWVGKCQRMILVSSSPLFADQPDRSQAITNFLAQVANGDFPTFSEGMSDERYYLGSWANIPYGLVTTYSSNTGASINLEGWLSKFSDETIGSDSPIASTKLYFSVFYLLRETDGQTPPGPIVVTGTVYTPDLRIVLNAGIYKTTSTEWLSLLERSSVQYEMNVEYP